MKYLRDNFSTGDLKKLDINELDSLCEDIRSFLIESISKTGGHLASNLGVVELTVALHYCYNSPIDKFVFDVGHQTYVHKILTGRLGQFDKLRQLNGISGFPKSCESPHDAFDTGHSSTAISAGLGMAVSRDLAGDNYHVLSIVGDGSITGGLAFEGLNNAGRRDTNFTVILNDNQMSISENVGALSKYLNQFRSGAHYLDAKSDVNNFLQNVPVIGEKLIEAVGKAKDGLRHLVIPGRIFENLGFRYVGPVDGHNISDLVKVLETVKKYKGPVLLHVYTKKGKGYGQAEEAPSDFHGVDSFNIDTGLPMKTKIGDTYSDVFGREIVRLAVKNEKIMAVSAAMPAGTGLLQFQKRYPKRFFDVGIAEGHAVTFSAGLAKNGFIPFFAVYSSFLQRSYDQIIHDVCLQKLHVIFAVDRAGVVGSDGETHQGMFDISFLSHIPNLTVMAPRNRNELIRMIRFAVDFNGPIAIRYPRGAVSGAYKYIGNEIIHGKSELIVGSECKRSKKTGICILSVGAMMDEAAEALKLLNKDGFEPALINVRFIKPIDMEMIKSLKNYAYIYVLEDGVHAGGFGSGVSSLITELGIRPKLFRSFAFPDEFIPQGGRYELFKKYGMTGECIYERIRNDLEDHGLCDNKRIGNEKI